MDKVKTANGTEFDCDYFNPFPPANQANIRILNESFASVATIFSDPEETKKLFYNDQILENHTKLAAIVNDSDALRVVLEKE